MIVFNPRPAYFLAILGLIFLLLGLFVLLSFSGEELLVRDCRKDAAASALECLL